MTTQGNGSDFRYFQPRLFEAIVIDLGGICPEVIFGSYRMPQGPKREANQEGRECLLHFAPIGLMKERQPEF